MKTMFLKKKNLVHIFRLQKSSQGFTLVELIMAAAIFGFISAAVVSAFFAGMRIWGRAANTDTQKTDRLLGLEKISRELRQMLERPGARFNGEQYSMYFPTVIRDSVTMVAYRFDPQAKTFFRAAMDLKTVLASKGTVSGVERPYFGVENMSLDYYCYDFVQEAKIWKSNCSTLNATLIAVRLNLTTKDGNFTKYVFIPQAR